MLFGSFNQQSVRYLLKQFACFVPLVVDTDFCCIKRFNVDMLLLNTLFTYHGHVYFVA